MNIGREIKNYMKQQGITQKGVAERCDMNKDTLSLKLNGKRPITTEEYELICTKGLQVSPSHFYKEV